MTNTLSVVDGFSVIIGPVWCNLAAMLTLLITIRVPPKYDDEDENRQAKGIFVSLIICHFILGLFKYLSTFRMPVLNEFTSVIMYGTVSLVSVLCYQWVFPRPFT